MLFAKDFFYSFIAFAVLAAVGAALGMGPIFLMMWLSLSPNVGFPLLMLFWISLGSLAFAIHEHRKRGGR